MERIGTKDEFFLIVFFKWKEEAEWKLKSYWSNGKECWITEKEEEKGIYAEDVRIGDYCKFCWELGI